MGRRRRPLRGDGGRCGDLLVRRFFTPRGDGGRAHTRLMNYNELIYMIDGGLFSTSTDVVTEGVLNFLRREKIFIWGTTTPAVVGVCTWLIDFLARTTTDVRRNRV